YVGAGLHEDAALTKYTQHAIRFELTLDLECDFADQDETRGEREQRGRTTRRWTEGEAASELTFDYEACHRYDHQGEKAITQIQRGVKLRFSNASSPPQQKGNGIVFSV